ncbi:MAG TPA: ferritin-like domain-containing protein [Thermoanaerobaculia bacterium]|nr:ferritin-like domain-containing protein [Thermoanaerobaculia bacterium]
MLTHVHRWIWSDAHRRGQKLLRFSETEIDGGRDILRAAELTSDPLLRRLYLVHATDELRHGQLFRRQGAAVLSDLASRSQGEARSGWIASSGHGLDDLQVENESDETMLAFLHVAEKDAAKRFRTYRDVLNVDPSTQGLFEEILHDEKFHMNYTLTQLTRVSPERHRRQLWYARLSRLWKLYLRLATAIGGAIGGLILTIQYFIVLPLFALLAKRAERREPSGWNPISPERNGSLKRQY